jgi:alpha,alpha-trehalase
MKSVVSRRQSRIATLTFLTILFLLFATTLGAQQPAPAKKAGSILNYIQDGWTALSRSPHDCKTVLDARNPDNSYLYVPAEMPITAELKELEQKCHIHVAHLPKEVHAPGDLAHEAFKPQGLLYLPNSYVVPGGFFNEMYGWDSYFIMLGLVQDNRVDLARGMVDNFLFEIEHYGAILNANRTYFLSRSQPPFLTSMIMAVHEANTKALRNDTAWITRAYPLAVRDYEMWTRTPHMAGDTGLSRYFDLGDGPVPEITDTNDSYYRDVAKQLERHPELNQGFLVPANSINTPESQPRFSLAMCPKGSHANCEVKTYVFTPDYYKGDRSDRESGYDITFRFAPFAGATHHYAAVCLNSLLYKAEQDLVELSRLAGHPNDSAMWQQRSQQRRAAVNKYLWDSKSGLYFDFDAQENRRSSYHYATVFFPLWAGMASKEQANAVAKSLAELEHPGGLATSNTDSGVQWDLPYGWAPLQLIAVEGLRRYGFDTDANRLSEAFLGTVVENFKRDGTIREKYNVVTRSSEAKVTAGYQTNVVGFGWTNGVFLQLLHQLPKETQSRIVK